jgi:hypothetical protein
MNCSDFLKVHKKIPVKIALKKPTLERVGKNFNLHSLK